jgi:hypothetical protein
MADIAEGLIEGPLAAALEANRDRCNAIVADARRTRVDFDLDRLANQLRGPMRATIEACEATNSGSGGRVLATLFGPLVELVGQRRVGVGSHDALVTSLPRLAPIVAEEPRLVFASLANAVSNLQAFGVLPQPWLDRIAAGVARGATAAGALEIGEVAGWALGLAHYRDSALTVAARLAPPMLEAAMGAPATVEALRADRWWRPDRPAPPRPAVVARVGGFRGFGGPFLEAPALSGRDGDVVVRSGDEAWLLHADAFGATLTRTAPEPRDRAHRPQAPLPDGVTPADRTVTDEMIAVTVATSYEVLVVAR